MGGKLQLYNSRWTLLGLDSTKEKNVVVYRLILGLYPTKSTNFDYTKIPKEVPKIENCGYIATATYKWGRNS
jgi:hypothetical protein